MFTNIMAWIRGLLKFNLVKKTNEIKNIVQEEALEFVEETAERIYDTLVPSKEDIDAVKKTINNTVQDVMKQNGILIESENEEKKE